MKKLYFLLFTILISATSFGQQFYAYSFEDDGSGTYTTSVPEFSDSAVSSGFDFFTSTFNNTIGANYGVTGQDGTHYFAGQDLDGESGPSNATLTFILDITGRSNLGMRILVAEDDFNDPGWDDSDFVHIDYSIDGGSIQNFLWFEAEGGGNSETRVDTDFDGFGDGITVPENFIEFQGALTGTGTTLTITITYQLNSGSEDLALDNIRLFENFTPSPEVVAAPSDVSGLDYDFASGPSMNSTFSVEGSNLGDFLTVALPAMSDFEISESAMGVFSNSINLTPDMSGNIASTIIYARLKSGLAINSYSDTVTVSSTGATSVTVNLSGNVIDGSTVNVGVTGNVDGVYINEIHYDNIEGDVGEFVEVAGPAGTDLSDYIISLYNGSDGELYGNGNDTFALSGTIDDEGSGVGAIVLTLPANGLQNGGPDGIALSKVGSSDIQFLTYEGVILNAGDGPAIGLDSEDIGIAESNSTTPVGASLEYDEATMTWIAIGTATPGSFTQGTVLSNNDFDTNTFSIFPNPTNTGEVSISSVNASPITVNVFDVLGKQVKSETISNNRLNVSNLKSGIYLLRITQDGATSTKKLVIR